MLNLLLMALLLALPSLPLGAVRMHSESCSGLDLNGQRVPSECLSTAQFRYPRRLQGKDEPVLALADLTVC